MQHLAGACQAICGIGQVTVDFTMLEDLDDQGHGRHRSVLCMLSQLLEVALLVE